jgi:protein TonB
MLHIVVTAEGLPASVTVQKSSGFTTLDDRAVEDVRKNWRFDPARKGGQPIQGQVIQPYIFKLEGTSSR